ncbi:hypothetical protein QO5_3300, partial [Clostridioides difficile F253]
LIIALNDIFYRYNFKKMCIRTNSLKFLKSNKVESLDYLDCFMKLI